MKVSLNWIKEFTPVDLSIDELVEKIGSQLGAVEEVIDLGKKYQGIVVAKVVECKEVEGSDHLHVCKIDDGRKVKNVERDKDGYVQVVCGAPNVREGLLVAWLPPGTTVPSTFDADPFVLEAREIRGTKSNGMLASAKELAIGDSHEGLLEIDYECQPGADFADVYKLNDYIIDIENKMFTHRPDCFGMLGVAREIAGIQQVPFRSPDWYKEFKNKLTPHGSGLPLAVKNELPELVPRFIAVVLSGIEIQPSSIWTQSFLSRVGIRPINNVVDVTNYMMLLTGQPLHAYDYDKVTSRSSGEKACIVIRHPKKGEKLTLLGGKVIEPRSEGIVIATDKELIGLGGVMGGVDTEVNAATKNIILECATFDMYNIRRTAMEHGLFTDAVTRFTKGQSPLQNGRVIMQAAEEMIAASPGPTELTSELIDDSHVRGSERPVHVTAEFINERLGLGLKAREMKKLLENVEFTVHEDKDILAVTPPFWRMDIEIAEDIVEEIGRLYGFDKLPLELPRRSLIPPARDLLLETKTKVRNVLSAAGANEVLTYSFIHSDLLARVGQDVNNAFQLGNALSPDLQYYRLSLVPSLLGQVHANIKADYGEFALFEINQTHTKDLIDSETKLPIEEYRLGFVFAADDKTAKAKYVGSPYYEAQKYVLDLLASFGVSAIFEPATGHEPKLAVGKAALAPFERGRAAYVKTLEGKLLGEIGEFTASTRRNLKLPSFSAGFELDIHQIMEQSKVNSHYVALPRFPKVEQDICLKVSAELRYGELFDFVSAELAKIQPKNTLPMLSSVDIYQRQDDKAHKQITLRLSIASYEKTMRDSEVTKLLDEVAKATKQKFGAQRI